MIDDTATGAAIDLRIIPRAGKTMWAGVRQQRLLLRVAAPPVEGAANEAVVRFLAHELDVAVSRVTIVAGERSREKRVQVEGLSAGEIRTRLGRG